MASLIIAAAVSLAWCAVAIWIGPRIGYLDWPDDPALKAHEQPAVPLGGVGVFLGVHLAAFAGGDLDLGLLLATSVVLVLGLVDDRTGLSPITRLGVEIAAAVALVATGSRAGDGLLALVLSVALVVLAINAVNLFDGLDGLAGSVALVTGFGLAWLAWERGLATETPLQLAAALVGFLVLGWHPARVFLGDAGAYVVGVILAHVIIVSSPDGVLQLIVAAGMLGVLAIDLVVTMLRRKIAGRPMFIGDRSHIYDQLRDRGWSVPRVAVGMAAAQAGIALIVVGIDRSLEPWQSLSVLAVVLVGSVGLLFRWGFLSTEPR